MSRARRISVCLLAALACVSSAAARWPAVGGGTGTAATADMPTGARPTTSVSGQSVTVSWAQSPFAGSTLGARGGGYEIKRYAEGATTAITPGPGCSGTNTGSTDPRLCVEANVPTGRWQYRVTPIIGSFVGTEGPFSPVAVVFAAPVLDSVTAQNPAAGVTNGPIAISWSAATGATGYNVFRRVSGGAYDYAAPLNGASPLTGVTYSDTTGIDRTTYDYVVRAVTAGPPPVASADSNQLSARVVTRPAAPAGAVTAVAGSGGAITVAWSAVSGADGYNVYRRANPGAFDYNTPLNGATPLIAPTFTEPAAATGADNAYVVRAVVGGASGVQVQSADSREGAPLRHATGTFTGDGVDNRVITIGFKPDLVIVKASTNQTGVLRTSSMTGDVSKSMAGATVLGANLVQSLDATGFTVGNAANVNTNTVAYTWVAFRAAAGALRVGSYTGDGVAGRAVPGAGFAPKWVTVLPAGAARANQRYSLMTAGFQFDDDVGTATRITALGTDGFTVAAGAEVNSNGATYHYVAVNEVAGSAMTGTYAGSGVNRSITGVGFAPDYVAVRANDIVTARRGRQRAGALAGAASQFYGTTADGITGITALQTDGFGLGTDTSVNAASSTYHWLAFKNAAGGCATQSSATFAATAGTWVDESSPASATGGVGSVLTVRSKSVNGDARALVQGLLPAVPPGCSITSARLRLYNSSPAAGRTLTVQANATAWTEAGATWANQPGVTAVPAATAVTTATAGYIEWNVTAQAQSMATGNDNGFSIRDSAEDAAAGPTQSFVSRQGTAAQRPELVVTVG